MRFILSFFTLFVVFATPLYAQEPMRLPIDDMPLIIKTQTGKHKFAVEVAKTREAHERGLMYRMDFPENRVMLFVYPEEREIAMWMANTPLALDMIFLDRQGRVVSVRANTTPYSLARISSGEPASYVIEALSGVAAKLGVKAGDCVRHRAIHATCK